MLIGGFSLQIASNIAVVLTNNINTALGNQL